MKLENCITEMTQKNLLLLAALFIKLQKIN